MKADFIERRWLSTHWSSTAAAADDAVEAMRARGAVHCRLTIRYIEIAPAIRHPHQLILEGWRETPLDGEGDPPV